MRPPKKGNLTPDGHPKATTIEAGNTAAGDESTAAGNENATDASIEITTSTNSTAIINGSPQSPPPLQPQSPSQLQQQQQQHSGTSNGNQAQATGSTDLIDSSNSNSATAAAASTSSAKPQYRTRAKTDHAKYGFDVVCITFVYFIRCVCTETWLHCKFPLFPHIHLNLFAKRVVYIT